MTWLLLLVEGVGLLVMILVLRIVDDIRDDQLIIRAFIAKLIRARGLYTEKESDDEI